METRARGHHRIQDQENLSTIRDKGTKGSIPIQGWRHGLAARGALGDMDTNVQAQRDINIGMVAVAAAEYEKKATLNGTAAARSNYSHVQSKVNTGLVNKSIQPSVRPPIKCEESTLGVAVKAVTCSRDSLKDSQNKSTKLKDSGSVLQAKKPAQCTKKPPKLSSVQEEKKVLKPILKEPTESLSKLKLAESTNCSGKSTQDINYFSPLVKLPNGIEDIDAADENSPLLVSIYVKDIYNYLTELELKFAVEPDHLKNQTVITGRMRAILIDWLVEVQQQFSLVLETLHLTAGIIDRYLQAVPNVQRNQFQLIGVTAMFIASKYEESRPPGVNDFVYMTDNTYCKADVFQCERDILVKLGFCLARPIPLSFLRRFMKAAHGTSKHHHLAKYFVDLCLVKYKMAHYRPSELAAAASCLSLYLLSGKQLKEVWTPTLIFYSKYTLEHIDPIIRKIAMIVVGVKDSKHKAVYNKYLDVSLAKVSSLPQLKGVSIYELTKTPSPVS